MVKVGDVIRVKGTDEQGTARSTKILTKSFTMEVIHVSSVDAMVEGVELTKALAYRMSAGTIVTRRVELGDSYEVIRPAVVVQEVKPTVTVAYVASSGRGVAQVPTADGKRPSWSQCAAAIPGFVTGSTPMRAPRGRLSKRGKTTRAMRRRTRG